MMAHLCGTIDRVVYENAANGYAIARVKSPSEPAGVILVGPLIGLTPGEDFEAEGSWETHARYGRQFRASSWHRRLPTTRSGIERYLGSGLIPGIGPKFAARLVNHFGEETLTVIDAHPSRLLEMPGLGTARAGAIQTAWREQNKIRDLMLLLETHHLPGKLATKIYQLYGDASLRQVRTNPFQLAHDIPGLSFQSLDRLALAQGLATDSPERLQAGLFSILSQNRGDGSPALLVSALLKNAAQMLHVPHATIQTSLKQLAFAGAVHLETDPITRETWCWPVALWNAEESVAQRLRKRLKRPSEAHPRLLQILAEVEQSEALVLSGPQRNAVMEACRNRVFILTGGPGTGKTTTLAILVKLLLRCELVVLCASPTGRAARHLSEVTGCEAQTLHRLLEYNPSEDKFKRDEDRPVAADVVLVDEASMLDIHLFEALLTALPPLAHLILVGDADQLPAIGPGRVLNDLLEISQIPSVRLTQIFRQAQTSEIVVNAHRIREGAMPLLREPTGEFRSDCYFLAAQGEEEILAMLLKVVSSSLPRRLGLDPLRDIQVLTPKNQGPLGTRALNRALRSALNPQCPDHNAAPSWMHAFSPGDKVIHVSNNYDKGVFNGDIGWVRAWDPEAPFIEVDMAGHRVCYGSSDIHELALAYAITVHKSQGSEFPAVVLPMCQSFRPLLQRHLLYTGLTRAQQVVVLIGEEAAVQEAVTSGDTLGRRTLLVERFR